MREEKEEDKEVGKGKEKLFTQIKKGGRREKNGKKQKDQIAKFSPVAIEVALILIPMQNTIAQAAYMHQNLELMEGCLVGGGRDTRGYGYYKFLVTIKGCKDGDYVGRTFQIKRH